MFVEVHALSGASEDAQNLGRLVAGAAEPVRHLGVELGGLSDAEDEILVAEHEAHLTGQDVEPLEPIMGAGVRLGLGSGDDDLPRLDASGSGQWEHDAAVHPPRLEPDAWVAHLGGTDQIVDGHPVGLREREQQLQTGAPLSVLQA